MGKFKKNEIFFSPYLTEEQAVSKWESEQATPDVEKIILMSDYFDVTTDYLLKGTEPVPAKSGTSKKEPCADVFAIAATAFSIMGLIVAAMVWYEKQTAAATAIGLIFLVTGCTVFCIGMTAVSDKAAKTKAKRTFWTINVWTIAFMPLSILYNISTGGYRTAPYPVLVGSVVKYALFWIVYIVTGLAVSLTIRKIYPK